MFHRFKTLAGNEQLAGPILGSFFCEAVLQAVRSHDVAFAGWASRVIAPAVDGIYNCITAEIGPAIIGPPQLRVAVLREVTRPSSGGARARDLWDNIADDNTLRALCKAVQQQMEAARRASMWGASESRTKTCTLLLEARTRVRLKFMAPGRLAVDGAPAAKGRVKMATLAQIGAAEGCQEIIRQALHAYGLDTHPLGTALTTMIEELATVWQIGEEAAEGEPPLFTIVRTIKRHGPLVLVYKGGGSDGPAHMQHGAIDCMYPSKTPRPHPVLKLYLC